MNTPHPYLLNAEVAPVAVPKPVDEDLAYVCSGHYQDIEANAVILDTYELLTLGYMPTNHSEEE